MSYSEISGNTRYLPNSLSSYELRMDLAADCRYFFSENVVRVKEEKIKSTKRCASVVVSGIGQLACCLFLR